MFYFWQGYLTRKTGEGIYKNSLYYHYTFSVHLKLFQNKCGILYLTIHPFQVFSSMFFSIFTRLCDHFNNQAESQETEQLMYVESWGRQRALGKSKEIWIKNRLQLILTCGYWFINCGTWNLCMWDANNKGNTLRLYEKSLYYLCDFSLKLFWKIIFT